MVAAQWLIETRVETPPRKRFTQHEVYRLMDAGFFDGQRFELIDGDLFDKSGQKPPHAYTIQLLSIALTKIFPPILVQIQLPVEASAEDCERSLPEPDVSVLAEMKREYGKRHPRGDELLLAVEVSDTTLGFDLSRKSALYATARVREYWVVDLVHRVLVVHRQTDGSTYRLAQIFSENDTVSIEGRTETVRVSEILPSRYLSVPTRW